MPSWTQRPSVPRLRAVAVFVGGIRRVDDNGITVRHEGRLGCEARLLLLRKQREVTLAGRITRAVQCPLPAAIGYNTERFGDLFVSTLPGCFRSKGVTETRFP